MFTLSFQHGLKTIEQDQNPQMCHIFSSNYHYSFWKMSWGPIGQGGLLLFFHLKHMSHLSAQQANCLLSKNQKSIQND